jgi:general stress protein 26
MNILLRLLLAASMCFASIARGEAPLTPAITTALEGESYIYVATRRLNGAWSDPAPVWFTYDGGVVYFTTSPTSHKARRIQQGSPVRIWVGRKDGPGFEGEAQLTKDLATVEHMSEAYGKKYWIAWIGLFRPRPGRVASGKTVAVKVTPTQVIP